MELRAKYREALIFILLAAFTALTTYKLYEAQLIQYAHTYDGLIHFTGPAPEQYRILPYLFLKAFSQIADFNIATLIFNFICFVLVYYIFYSRILTSLSSRARWAVLILFSLLYPVFMVWGYRPVTVFSILLVAYIVANYQQLARITPTYRDLGLLAVLLLFLSFTRADTAFFTALFLCIYLRNRLPVLIRICYLALPILVQFVLTESIFPEASYPESIVTFTFLSNLSWRQFWFSAPLVYFLLAVALSFPNTIRRLAVYIRREHMALVFLFGVYTLVIICIGRPREFRLYLAYIPMMLMVLNGYYHMLKLREDMQQDRLQTNAEGEEVGAGRAKDT